MCTEEPLSLEAALTVVGALECVVRRCVGPQGGSVLFTKDTGETLITRHGQRILTALHLEHPVARTVLECVGAHERVTGDGSKSFVLLLAALLRGIHGSSGTRRGASGNAAHARRLADRLLAFAWNELDDVIAQAVLPYSSDLVRFSGCEADGGVLAALVDGYMAGRVGAGQAAALTPVLCELQSKVSRDEREAIAFLDSNFSRLCMAVSGLPSSYSHLVEGLVLDCNWSVWRETEGPARALVVHENLDAPLSSVCPGALTVRFQEDWIARSENALRQRLAPLLGRRVTVLLSSVKQSERVLEWAGLNGISVLDCCDRDQLDLLCELTGVETVPPGRVAPLARCGRTQTGGCRRANLGIPPHRSLRAYTLVLCAPTPGALEQSVSASRGVFGMLRHLSQASLGASGRPSGSRDSRPPQIRSRCDSEQARGSPESRASAPSPGRNFWGSVIDSGGVVPVGGAFELLLHRSLLHGGNHGDESRRLLAEAVLSIPESLHPHKPRRFLQHRAAFLTKLRLLKQSQEMSAKFTLGQSRQGAGPVHLEPVCSKHQLVASVLQCVNRLLCVGAVLRTHTSLHKAHASVSEDSEDEPF